MNIFKKKEEPEYIVDPNGKCNNFTPNEDYMHLLNCSCCNNEDKTLCNFCIHSDYNGKRRV